MVGPVVPRFRPVWHRYPWVFWVWLVGVACAVAMCLGFILDAGTWKYLAMLGSLLSGTWHSRLIGRLAEDGSR